MLATENGVAIRRRMLDRFLTPPAKRRTIPPGSHRILYERPIPERHRIIFYVGHLEAFDCNLLGKHGFGVDGFHPALDRLFAFGIDPVSSGLPSDLPSDWPPLSECGVT